MLNHTQETAAAPLAASMLHSKINRRRFLQAAGVTAGAAGLSGCDGVLGVDPSSGPAPSVVEVIQFALNLEYLEAQFYSYAVTGRGIASSDLGSSPGAVTGFNAIAFKNSSIAALAQQLAADELAHVRLIRLYLSYTGTAPVSMPALNLKAAGAPTNDIQFVALARSLETVGTSAYEGAIQYLIPDLTALNYAAVIHDTEAQHEGALRQACILLGASSPAVDKYDRPPVLGPATMFNTSYITGVNTARNASEVLQIAYLAPGKTGVSSGGFFPKGFNGGIKTT